jgi:hypothetical protein
MTTLYWMMRPVDRRIGNPEAAAECVHQSVHDRIALASSAYAPAGRDRLRQLPVVTTSRIARGVPC